MAVKARVLGWIVMGAALVGGADVSFGQDRQVARAKRLVDQAKQKAAAGDNVEALRLLQMAYEVSRNPGILFNIAAVEDARPNNCKQAYDAFQRYLDACERCSGRSLGEQRLKNVEKRCRVEVSVSSQPIGAAVRIAGEGRGATPVTFDSWPGVWELTLSLEGHAPIEETLTVSEDTPVRVNYVLKPVPKTGQLKLVNMRSGIAVRVNSQAVGAEALAGLTLNADAHRLEMTDASGRSFVHFVQVGENEVQEVDVGGLYDQFVESNRPSGAIATFWTATGVTVVAAAVGTAFTVLNAQTNSDIDGTFNPAERRDLQDTADQQALAATIAFSTAGAGALVALGAWLWPTLADGGDPIYW